MKKILLSITAVLFSISCMAQAKLSFPFKGGKDAMTQFFKDSLVVSPEIIQKKATGLVVFKFTADAKGTISKVIAYYAEDTIFVTPVSEGLMKSNHMWVLTGRERSHDFIISFAFRFNPPATAGPKLQKAVYDNYRNQSPIFADDQVPIDVATLLPTVVVNYGIPVTKAPPRRKAVKVIAAKKAVKL